METIVDDQGESVELGAVLYDLQIGEFVRLERNGDTVREIDVFSGDVCYEVSVEEFTTECLASEYRVLPETVTENPEKVLERVLTAFRDGSQDPVAGYDPWEVRFAQNICTFEKQELK
jgi:hypothetical protein